MAAEAVLRILHSDLGSAVEFSDQHSLLWAWEGH